jgi:hypothetical protein
MRNYITLLGNHGALNRRRIVPGCGVLGRNGGSYIGLGYARRAIPSAKRCIFITHALLDKRRHNRSTQ